MELKRNNTLLTVHLIGAFNRTRMELKRGFSEEQITMALALLTVPEWN